MTGHPIFATIYDRLLASAEKAGMADIRAELLAQASGRTLEIGAGTAANAPYYPEAVTELVLTEPDPHMAKRIPAKLESDPPRVGAVEVVEAPAEALPFGDGEFDTVVSTLALCTVQDPEKVVAEVNRVLKPGGRFLFLEHVRGEEGSGKARWQDRLERPWGWFSGGCHPNRPTGALLERSFASVDVEDGEFPGSAPPLVKPLIHGAAHKA